MAQEIMPSHDPDQVASLAPTLSSEEHIESMELTNSTTLAVDKKTDMDVSSPSPDSTSKPDLTGVLCAVCSDRATGRYFGARICEACKSFFIRSTKKGEPTFKCVGDQNCPITLHSRLLCQYCRYQRCMKAGMGHKAKNRHKDIAQDQVPCKVCGDVSSGIHFGVFTCEGCKGFFRRSLKDSSMYTCSGNEDCIITPVTRNLCRFCRFKKCQAVGMSRSSIKLGRHQKYEMCFNATSSASDVTGHILPGTITAGTKSDGIADDVHDSLSENSQTFKQIQSFSHQGGLSPQSAKTEPVGQSKLLVKEKRADFSPSLCLRGVNGSPSNSPYDSPSRTSSEWALGGFSSPSESSVSSGYYSVHTCPDDPLRLIGAEAVSPKKLEDIRSASAQSQSGSPASVQTNDSPHPSPIYLDQGSAPSPHAFSYRDPGKRNVLVKSALQQNVTPHIIPNPVHMVGASGRSQLSSSRDYMLQQNQIGDKCIDSGVTKSNSCKTSDLNTFHVSGDGKVRIKQEAPGLTEELHPGTSMERCTPSGADDYNPSMRDKVDSLTPLDHDGILEVINDQVHDTVFQDLSMPAPQRFFSLSGMGAVGMDAGVKMGSALTKKTGTSGGPPMTGSKEAWIPIPVTQFSAGLPSQSQQSWHATGAHSLPGYGRVTDLPAGTSQQVVSSHPIPQQTYMQQYRETLPSQSCAHTYTVEKESGTPPLLNTKRDQVVFSQVGPKEKSSSSSVWHKQSRADVASTPVELPYLDDVARFSPNNNPSTNTGVNIGHTKPPVDQLTSSGQLHTHKFSDKLSSTDAQTVEAFCEQFLHRVQTKQLTDKILSDRSEAVLSQLSAKPLGAIERETIIFELTRNLTGLTAVMQCLKGNKSLHKAAEYLSEYPDCNSGIHWEKFHETVSLKIIAGVQFIKKIPGFDRITMNDRMALIKHSIFLIILIHKVWKVGLEWRWMEQTFFSNNTLRRMSDGFKTVSYNFLNTFSMWKFDSIEVALLMILTVVNPDLPLEDEEVVIRLHKDIRDILRHYCQETHGTLDHYYILLQFVPILINIEAVHKQSIQKGHKDMPDVSLPALFAEINLSA